MGRRRGGKGAGRNSSMSRRIFRNRSLGNLGQAKVIVKLPVREKSSVRGNLGIMEFELEATVEIDPQMRVSWLTRRVTRGSPVVMLVLR